MGKRKKKNKPNTPRHTRLKRSGRLQAAKHWIPKYEGENIVKGYAKHFAVDKICAVKELEMLGYTIKDTYKQELKDAEMQKQREAEKQKQEEDFWIDDSDETFVFIAGYTSGGIPFGTTWEELDEIENEQTLTPVNVVAKNDNDPYHRNFDNPIDIYSKDLPF